MSHRFRKLTLKVARKVTLDNLISDTRALLDCLLFNTATRKFDQVWRKLETPAVKLPLYLFYKNTFF